MKSTQTETTENEEGKREKTRGEQGMINNEIGRESAKSSQTRSGKQNPSAHVRTADNSFQSPK